MNRRKIKSLATRENRDGYLLWVSRTKDEFDVPRGFLERLKQRIERLRRQHVDFVDDVDLIGCSARTHQCVLPQGPDLVDPAIAGTVDLDHIHVFPGIDRKGDFRGRVKSSVPLRRSVESFGENACGTSFANSSRPSKQVSMADSMSLNSPEQRLRGSILPNEIFERLGPISSGHDGVLRGFLLLACFLVRS